jgi:membrane-associated phospholipid phosphatase
MSDPSPCKRADYPGEPPLQQRGSESCGRLSRCRAWRVIAWVVVLAAFLVLLKLDVPIMRWGSRVFPLHAAGWTQQFLLGFRDFGQILPVIVTCVVVAAFDVRRRRIITAILLAQLLAMAIYNVGKLTVVRYRPDAGVVDVRDPAVRSADSWAGLAVNNLADRTQSFPSGHSAAAFALGTVLAAFYPRLAWLFWALAVGCACSRFIQFFHWPSDCLAGAVIGYLCARLVLRVLGPSTKCALAERLKPVIGIAEGLPADLAEHHDQYLHGRRKE